MQTTLRIQDDLYREAKAEAAREGITLTRFLEEALRSRLRKKPSSTMGKPHPFPVYDPLVPNLMTNEEIKKYDEEEQMRHDLKKLGIDYDAL